MKIERLRKFNLWKCIAIFSCIAVIGLVITLKVTQAKYRYTSKINIVNGTISYKTGDVSVLAINLENDDGTYTESEDFPTSGYSLNTEKSYCARSVDGEMVTQEVDMSYVNNTFIVTGLSKKGTKCFLYFDIDHYCNGNTACISIMANNTVDTSRSNGSFTSVFTDDTAGKIFSGTDDYGTTYFFAGSNPNNWVIFAGIYWRIIRINGDGSIRLIYNGSDTTGTTTQLDSTSIFNYSNSYSEYSGYMYTIGSVHGLGTSSTIKGILDTWYKDNLLLGYASYIDTDAGFCGDRQPSTSETEINGSGGTGSSRTYYAGFIRNRSMNQYTYSCAETSDLYTVSSSSYGNKALTYPVGLITMDEVAFAGAYGTAENSDYWLYTKSVYWTHTPSYTSNEFVVNSLGVVNINGALSSSYGVRPVINLKSSITFSGTGTTNDPYLVGT